MNNNNKLNNKKLIERVFLFTIDVQLFFKTYSIVYCIEYNKEIFMLYFSFQLLYDSQI